MKFISTIFKYIVHYLQYINDFSNISIVTCSISTIFLIYRSIDKNDRQATPFSSTKEPTHSNADSPITYLPKNEVTALIPALNSFHLYGVRIQFYLHQISEDLLDYTYATHSFLL